MSPQPIRRELPLVALAFLAVAIACTWPLVLDLEGALLFAPRRFDGYGTIWLGEHAWRALTAGGPWMVGDTVAWPSGLDLRLADSFLFGLLYLPFRAAFSPPAAFNMFCLAAISATATSGYWMARYVLRTGRLAAAAAGLIIGFNALMHTYRIEGEAYLLAGLFLPLLAGCLARTAQTGLARDGAWAGLCLAALGWSSGYYAIDGVLLCSVLGIAALAGAWRPGPVKHAAPGIAAFVVVSLITLLPLVIMVGSALDGALAARFPEGQDPLRNVALDAASLSGLLVPFPGSAHLRQGRIAWIGMAPLTLGCLALTLRRPKDVLPWLGLAGVGVLLSLGPFLRLDDTGSSDIRLPYAWAADLSKSVLAYRMPARFLALTFTGLAAATALGLEQLRRDGLGIRWRAALLSAVAFDALFMTGFATDRTFAPAEFPAGYSALSGRGAVLDMWGHDRDLLRYAGLSAWYQVHHGQPIMADFTRAGDTQSRVGRRLALHLLSGNTSRARAGVQLLANMGVTDLALHMRTFGDADLVGIRPALQTIAQRTPVEADTEIDIVEVYRLPEPTPGVSIRDAQAGLDAWLESDG